MIEGENTKQLKAQMKAEHYEAAHRSLLVGSGLFFLGVFLIVTTMVFFFQTAFDKWFLIPMALGFILSILGAHVISNKRMSAAIKDVGDALFRFKKQ